MRHISLDESFWRSAAEALASGEPLEDVEPSLLEVSQLLQRIQESARETGARLGLVTLGATEQERALGLVVAASLASRGSRTLLLDLDFADDTWSRLLGAEELEGIVDHVAYGISPSRLVRPTSWKTLSLVPAGSVALSDVALLGSSKIRNCIDVVSRNQELVCIGIPFDDSLDWGPAGVAGIKQALLIGSPGDELAFELAIPKLVPHVELLATMDAPSLGRWRASLAAALPAVGSRSAELSFEAGLRSTEWANRAGGALGKDWTWAAPGWHFGVGKDTTPRAGGPGMADVGERGRGRGRDYERARAGETALRHAEALDDQRAASPEPSGVEVGGRGRAGAPEREAPDREPRRFEEVAAAEGILPGTLPDQEGPAAPPASPGTPTVIPQQGSIPVGESPSWHEDRSAPTSPPDQRDFPSDDELSLLPPPASPAPGDPEAAADVAFLSRFTNGESVPAGVHPKLRVPPAQPSDVGGGPRELELDPATLREQQPPPWEDEAAWGDEEEEDDEDEAMAIAVGGYRDRRGETGTRWGTTALAVILCLFLGAGAFWYWRSNQQIPEGEFTFVDASGSSGTVSPGERSDAGQGGPSTDEGAGGAVGGDGKGPSLEATSAPSRESGKQSKPEATAATDERKPAATREGEPKETIPGQADKRQPPESGRMRAGAADAADQATVGDRERRPPPAPTEKATAAADDGPRERDAAERAKPSADGDDTPERAAAIPKPAGEPPDDGPVLAYSVHVGSYQTFAAARRAADALRRQGKTAFVAPVLLEEKGQWYRVFMETVEDAPKSEAILARAKEQGVIQEGNVRETPWALYLGRFDDPAAAREIVAALDRSGISAYAVGEGPVLLYAGAFESAADAELLNRQLKERGFDAALVRRRGAAHSSAGSASPPN